MLQLEKKEGKEALMKLGNDLCKHWVKKGPFTQDKSRPVQRDMHILINFFLIEMRQGFCNLIIAHQSEAFMSYWRTRELPSGNGQPYTDARSYDPDLYKPKYRTIFISDAEEAVIGTNPARRNTSFGDAYWLKYQPVKPGRPDITVYKIRFVRRKMIEEFFASPRTYDLWTKIQNIEAEAPPKGYLEMRRSQQCQSGESSKRALWHKIGQAESGGTGPSVGFSQAGEARALQNTAYGFL
ncbi:hypothetical protein GE09DRAFT_1185062 [Coniochaeta sp. 2T2.1]|nr:hypothetical protein GE09DRAFT_1185062 [Coniochaeta sp. 2T2.1]